MSRSCALPIVLLIWVLAPLGSRAEDEATSRRVTGQEQAQAAQVLINQIDTSAFPKVTLFVTVLKDGVPLKGLAASDFKVREDEVDQEPLTVVPKLTPLSAVITLDTSGSMSKRLADAQSAAISFVDTLASDDQVQVLSFAREVKTLAALSTNHAQAKAAIAATVARGDTALYDALYASVVSLQDKTGRKAITLLSDGADDDGTGKQLSKHSLDDALALARQVNVPIFTIGVGSGIDESVLKKVAEQTGAAYLLAPQPAELKSLYGKISEQLSGQYNIYYTSNLLGDGSMHNVRLDYGKAFDRKEYKSPTLTTAVAPPKAPVAAAPAGESINIALAKNGGQIADFSSQYDDGTWAVKNLIDGNTNGGWAGKTNGPQAVVIGFKNGELAEVTDIVINPYTKEGPEKWASEVEFFASATYAWKDFTPLGKLTLKPEGTDQGFELPSPVQARYIKVLFKKNGGGSYMEAGEIEVFGRLLGAGDPVPALTNWASKSSGGSIEKFTSEYDSGTWTVAHLIDGVNGVGDSWAGSSGSSQEVVIKLGERKEISDLAINAYAPEQSATWATEVEIFTSEQFAHKGFVSHGVLSIPIDGDFHVVTLPAPVSASFVKAVFKKNGGGSYMEAGEVRAYGR